MSHPDDLAAIQDARETLASATPVTIRRVTQSGTYDPHLGKAPTITADTTVRGLVTGVKPTQVARSEGLMLPTDLQVLIPGGLGFEPAVTDKVIIGGQEHAIIFPQRGAGLQEPCTWTLTVRRG